MVDEPNGRHQFDVPQNRSFTLPESFSTPRFKFGDWVEVEEGYAGMIIGMTVTGFAPDDFWMYQIDFPRDSLSFWLYGGVFFEEKELRGVDNYPEKNGEN